MIATGDGWTLHNGDCLVGLRTLADNSVDAIVTDPPAGIGFMGRQWDSDKGGRVSWIAWLTDVMRECLRVLKPGGHALVWALPRTSHWTATAIEEAGFEIRDVVHHLFGSGFPKSLDVSKAIDAAAGAERSRVLVPTKKGNAARLGEGVQGVAYGDSHGGFRDVSDPATDAAQQWQGWGTALKPAAEHWILARKPLDGTVAANVLKHGTGGLNVDGCRVGTSKNVPASAATIGNEIYGSGMGSAAAGTGGSGFDPNVGRWPAHLVLSHHDDCTESLCDEGCPVRVLDGQSGVDGPRPASVQNHTATSNVSMSGGNSARLVPIAADMGGGASRFFYIAKPPRAEKDAGLEHLPKRSGGEATAREDGTAGLKNPRAGAGRTGGARNIHPTVKSIALMRWLCRLVTPPGGLVLDAFAGSGTTGVACIEEGFRFVGFELGEDYFEIATARIGAATRQLDLFKAATPKNEDAEPVQIDLFGGAA